MCTAVDHDEVTYTLRDGPAGELTIRHAGQPITLNTGKPTTIALRHREPLLPALPQPPGREPHWNSRRLDGVSDRQ